MKNLRTRMLSSQGEETHGGGLRSEEELGISVVTKNALSPMRMMTKINT